ALEKFLRLLHKVLQKMRHATLETDGECGKATPEFAAFQGNTDRACRVGIEYCCRVWPRNAGRNPLAQENSDCTL
ncbi:MAG: hypothetical protein ACKOFW_05760, partial [Planctomycetaceae bacterium]